MQGTTTVGLSRKRPLSQSSHSQSVTAPQPSPSKRHQKSLSTAGQAAVLYNLDPSSTTSNPKQIDIPLNHTTIKVGRSKSKNNNYILTPLDCSTMHCEIGLVHLNGKDILYLKDLSSNGTFLNGMLVGKGNTCLVRPGDKVSFAGESHYIVKYSSALETKNSENNNNNNNNSSIGRPNEGNSTRKTFYDSYTLGALLGTGHYAQVKTATHRQTGCQHAVKIFHPTKNDDASHTKSKGLTRELDILMKIKHPNIVKFHDVFLESVDLTKVSTYLVLEKINGGELFHRIVNKGKLKQLETKILMSQLLDGLQYLHGMGIAHRDLKPENILLEITYADDTPSDSPWDEGESDIQVKIADFGLAKFIGNFNYTNTLCGTPAYVAPEVLVNSTARRYNKAVDMWSVGVLLYVCLCGFQPFSEELGPPSMRQQILDGRYAFFSPYWDSINDLVLDLISRLLIVDPLKRLTVGETLAHRWFSSHGSDSEKKEEADLSMMSDVDMKARQMSIRIPSSTRGYSNPVTLTERVKTGINADESMSGGNRPLDIKEDMDISY